MKTTTGFVKNVILGAAALSVLLGSCKKQPQQQTETGVPVITVNAATSAHPRPFTYIDENNKLLGHNVELVEAVFERLPQYRLAWEVTDFPSIFAGLDANRYQLGVNNFAMNEDRRQKYTFTAPIIVNSSVAAVRADDNSWPPRITSMSDLAGKTTRVSVGTNMTTAIENYNKEHPEAPIKHTYSEADVLVGLQLVESGQHDFNLLPGPLFNFYTAEFGLKLKAVELDEGVMSSGTSYDPYSYLIVSKGNEKLAEEINRVLLELYADGTSKRINEKYYGGSDHSPQISSWPVK